ncbi:hypothetical protein KJS94_01505 [Flavihumibacter rivuli]|uniref:hypothetical protein n=1 Tax=Flavihumibacter rivuli TaxID=2838156 RepID=UPI001BDED58A|nr:hypothetical protein [Flavihumibacter rivuli]ULQ56872.1 hypothetical protein KJS94_01505 [Flavihumibacter rivuli]
MSMIALGTYIKLGIIGAGILIGFLQNEKLTTANRTFWFFLVIAGSFEILERMMGVIFQNNFPLYHVARPLFYGILTWGLATGLGRFRKLFLLTVPLVWLAAWLNARTLQPPATTLNTIVITFTSLLLILQVLLYVTRLFEYEDWNTIMYRGSFWIVLGILINSISSFLTLSIYNSILNRGNDLTFPILVITEWLFYLSFSLNFILQSKGSPQKSA